MQGINFQEEFDRATQKRDDGHVGEALLIFQDLAALAEEEKDLARAALAYHMAGNSVKMTIGFGEESKFRSASGFLSRAYAHYVSLGDQVSQGAVLRDIAVSADKVGRYSIATESFQRSIELLSGTEDTAQLAITYDKLGCHFLYIKQFDQALPYFDKALSLLRQTPTSGFFWATSLFDRGIAQYLLQNYENARDDIEESLSWFEADHGQANYYVRRTQCSSILTRIYEQLGDQKLSGRYAAQASKLLRRVDTEVAARIQAEVERFTALG